MYDYFITTQKNHKDICSIVCRANFRYQLVFQVLNRCHYKSYSLTLESDREISTGRRKYLFLNTRYVFRFAYASTSFYIRVFKTRHAVFVYNLLDIKFMFFFFWIKNVTLLTATWIEAQTCATQIQVASRPGTLFFPCKIQAEETWSTSFALAKEVLHCRNVLTAEKERVTYFLPFACTNFWSYV